MIRGATKQTMRLQRSCPRAIPVADTAATALLFQVFAQHPARVRRIRGCIQSLGPDVLRLDVDN